MAASGMLSPSLMTWVLMQRRRYCTPSTWISSFFPGFTTGVFSISINAVSFTTASMLYTACLALLMDQRVTVARTIIPPMKAKNPGASPTTRKTHTGLKRGSIIPMREQERGEHRRTAMA